MANKKELDSIIQIDGEDYKVTAEKVTHKLTIKTVKDGVETEVEFDGSQDMEITVAAGGGEADSAETADKIQVNMDNDQKAYATITVSKNDPTASVGSGGDIWFKY